MTNAIYTRVSKGSGQDVGSQLPDLRRWAAADGGPCAWYTDASTGKVMARPGFDRLLAEVRAGSVDTVVVWRLDRLGRTASGLTALFDELVARKVNLVSLRDGLDLATPAGRLMANVLASVAAFETEVRAERIHAGLEVARAKGVRLGRPKGSGLGVRKKVKPEQMAVALRMIAEGQGITAIARATGLSRSTVYTMIPVAST